MEAIRIYRDLLRAVRRHIGSDSSKSHFRDYVAAEFRKNMCLQDPPLVQQKMKLAQNYMLLLNSVHHHKDLLFSYNIAVDREDEMKLKLKRSASSVGLQLPEHYKE
uniref:Complex 1 LYR protein n=1 Tax=Araucaria cunninghamii TaxID=56994 RepID=A0A0D6R9B3_ARACU